MISIYFRKIFISKKNAEMNYSKHENKKKQFSNLIITQITVFLQLNKSQLTRSQFCIEEGMFPDWPAI